MMRRNDSLGSLMLYEPPWWGTMALAGVTYVMMRFFVPVALPGPLATGTVPMLAGTGASLFLLFGLVSLVRQMVVEHHECKARQVRSVPRHYALREPFLTPVEQAFCQVLRSIVSPGVTICPKVPLTALARPRNSAWSMVAKARMMPYQVDFLICDLVQMRPCLVVKLDDDSNDPGEQSSRDEFLDEVLSAAGLPLAHVSVSQALDAREVQRQIEAALGLNPVRRP